MIDMVLLCGKAASGKDSLMKDIVKKHPDIFNRDVSYTTRARRDKEVDGVDYHFISDDLMAKLIMSNQMLEVAEFNGWFYGTSYMALARDKINIGIYSPDGVYQVLESKEINPLIFYIDASDKTRFLRYLNREENPNIAEMVRRYGTDEKDFNEFFNSGVHYTTLVNETRADYQNILEIIIEEAKQYFEKN